MQEGLFHSEIRAILERFGYLVRRRALRLSGDEALAEHALRQTFEAAGERGADLRSMSDKLGWLYQAVDESCIEAIEAGRVRPEDPVLALTPKLDEDSRIIAMRAYIDRAPVRAIIEETGASAQRVDKVLRDLEKRTGRSFSGDLYSPIRVERFHSGTPDPELRRHISELDSDSPHELCSLITELDDAKKAFLKRDDLDDLVPAVSEPDAPIQRSPKALFIGTAVAGLAVLALLFAPVDDAVGTIPPEFALTVIVERGQQMERSTGPSVSVEGGDKLRLELAIPEEQTGTVIVLEDDGSLTPLAYGRLFRPGIHLLPQTLHVDELRKLDAKIFAGTPAAVRTATSTGDLGEVLVLEVHSRSKDSRGDEASAPE